MSERMIELQRARILARGGAATPSIIPNGLQAQAAATPGASTLLPGQAGTGTNSSAASGSTHRQVLHATPQQAAAAAQRHEDAQMQLFLHRLQNRNDSRPQSTSAPTVPTALSRRILHRQGVGYLDETVAAVVSGAADRFVATVLQQAAACRDQRLKGAELAREAKRHRARHMQQHEADVAERTRRKAEHEEWREKDKLAAIQAAEALKTKSSPGDGASKAKRKKKLDEPQMNGNKRKQRLGGGDDDEESYDSIDEEEEYYQEHYSGVDEVDTSDDDEEDDDDMLILRDIARPLEAWDFHIDGKLGMETAPKDNEPNELTLEDDDHEDEVLPPEAQEDGDNDERDAGSKKDAKPAEENKKTSRKSSNSPSPSKASAKSAKQLVTKS